MYTPNFLDIHDFNKHHKHIGIIYFLKSKTDQVTLEAEAYHVIEWVSETGIGHEKYNLDEGMKFYIKEAFSKAKDV